MRDIDFVQKNNKRKKAFIADTFSRIVLNEVFPVMKDVSNDNIHIINYVIFRSKRLFDVVVRYKDMDISMALDFSIDSNLENTSMLGYQAIYKLNISVVNDEYENILFDYVGKQQFNVSTFKEFLGNDAIRFSILYDNYYDKNNSPMQFKQHAMKTRKRNEAPTEQVAFNSDFNYMNETSGFFFNIYSNEIERNASKNRVEELFYQLKPMEGHIAGTFSDFDFWATIKDSPSMIAEPFRKAIQKHYNVDDYVIPHFDSHIDLFDFYNNEQKRIKDISEMIKI